MGGVAGYVMIILYKWVCFVPLTVAIGTNVCGDNRKAENA